MNARPALARCSSPRSTGAGVRTCKFSLGSTRRQCPVHCPSPMPVRRQSSGPTKAFNIHEANASNTALGSACDAFARQQGNSGEVAESSADRGSVLQRKSCRNSWPSRQCRRPPSRGRARHNSSPPPASKCRVSQIRTDSIDIGHSQKCEDYASPRAMRVIPKLFKTDSHNIQQTSKTNIGSSGRRQRRALPQRVWRQPQDVLP